jgi:hypothetical protein
MGSRPGPGAARRPGSRCRLPPRFRHLIRHPGLVPTIPPPLPTRPGRPARPPLPRGRASDGAVPAVPPAGRAATAAGPRRPGARSRRGGSRPDDGPVPGGHRAARSPPADPRRRRGPGSTGRCGAGPWTAPGGHGHRLRTVAGCPVGLPRPASPGRSSPGRRRSRRAPTPRPAGQAESSLPGPIAPCPRPVPRRRSACPRLGGRLGSARARAATSSRDMG